MFSFSHKLLVILEIVTLLWNKYIVMNSLIQAGLQGTSSERADCEAEATAAACALALPLWAFRPCCISPFSSTVSVIQSVPLQDRQEVRGRDRLPSLQSQNLECSQCPQCPSLPSGQVQHQPTAGGVHERR